MLSHVRVAFWCVLSRRHTKELFSRPHLVSIQSFVHCGSFREARSALPLHLLGEAMALLKPAGVFSSFPVKHVFS